MSWKHIALFVIAFSFLFVEGAQAFTFFDLRMQLASFLQALQQAQLAQPEAATKEQTFFGYPYRPARQIGNKVGRCISTNLSYGDQGEAVKNLQQLLRDRGYYHGKITGYFDNQTWQAVKAFQKNEGLLSPQSFWEFSNAGEVDARTRNALNRYCKQMNTSPQTRSKNQPKVENSYGKSSYTNQENSKTNRNESGFCTALRSRPPISKWVPNAEACWGFCTEVQSTQPGKCLFKGIVVHPNFIENENVADCVIKVPEGAVIRSLPANTRSACLQSCDQVGGNLAALHGGVVQCVFGDRKIKRYTSSICTLNTADGKKIADTFTNNKKACRDFCQKSLPHTLSEQYHCNFYDIAANKTEEIPLKLGLCQITYPEGYVIETRNTRSQAGCLSWCNMRAPWLTPQHGGAVLCKYDGVQIKEYYDDSLFPPFTFWLRR